MGHQSFLLKEIWDTGHEAFFRESFCRGYWVTDRLPRLAQCRPEMGHQSFLFREMWNTGNG